MKFWESIQFYSIFYFRLPKQKTLKKKNFMIRKIYYFFSDIVQF